MAQTVAIALTWLLGIYLALGVIAGSAFVWFGARRIDPAAREGTLGFRLAIWPGAIALWPFVLQRWRSSDGEPPSECNAHRIAASQDAP